MIQHYIQILIFLYPIMIIYFVNFINFVNFNNFVNFISNVSLINFLKPITKQEINFITNFIYFNINLIE